MWKPLALVAACCVLAGTQMALADGGSNPSTAPSTVSEPCTPMKTIYAPKRWRRDHPLRGENPCPTTSASKKKLRSRFADYRIYRHVATYHAPFGHGPPSPADGRWWAKPWPVICGESRGDFYVNADGAYQIIPSTWAAYGGTRFAPTAGAATPLEQHIIGHRAAVAGEAWYGWKTDCA